MPRTDDAPERDDPAGDGRRSYGVTPCVLCDEVEAAVDVVVVVRLRWWWCECEWCVVSDDVDDEHESSPAEGEPARPDDDGAAGRFVPLGRGRTAGRGVPTVDVRAVVDDVPPPPAEVEKEGDVVPCVCVREVAAVDGKLERAESVDTGRAR